MSVESLGRVGARAGVGVGAGAGVVSVGVVGVTEVVGVVAGVVVVGCDAGCDASAVMVTCAIVICAERTFSDLNRFARLNDGNPVLL